VNPLAPGTELEPGDVQAPGAVPGTPIVIENEVGETPNGRRYASHQGTSKLVVTAFDAEFVAHPETRSTLVRDLGLAASIRHRNLVDTLGTGPLESSLFVARADVGGTSMRTLLHDRLSRGKRFDLEFAYNLCAHVCNALAAIHRHAVHAFVTLDTVCVTGSGRVLLSGTGEGPTLPRAPGFERFRTAGLLPMVTPEMLTKPQEIGPPTDVFGVASLFVEVLTGQALVHGDVAPDQLDLDVPPALLQCLQRALANDPSARHARVGVFKTELQNAYKFPTATPVLGVPTLIRAKDQVDLAERPITRTPKIDVPDVDASQLDFAPPPSPLPPGAVPNFASDRRSTSALDDLGFGALDTLTPHRLTSLDGVESPTSPPSAPPALPSRRPRDPARGGSRDAVSLARPPASNTSSLTVGGENLASGTGPLVGLDTATAGDEHAPTYLIVRTGADEGPYSLAELRNMILSGELQSVHTLRSKTTLEAMLVVDHPMLRPSCEQRRRMQERATKRIPVRAPRQPPRRRLAVTILWVVITLTAFGVAAWYVSWSSG